MAGARQEDMSGAMMNILKKMDTMLESTNEIYQEQLFILNSIDTIQKTAVVVELQNQTKILQSIDSKLNSQVGGSGGLGNVKVFKEAFGDVAGVIEKLLKATEKLDDKKTETIANFFTKLAESINKFVKDVDAEKAKVITETIKGIAGGVFLYSLMMIVATPLLIAALPGAFLFGLSLKLLFKGLGSVDAGSADAMNAVLGLAKGIVLYSLAMALVTVLMPIVLIGSFLFGLSIRALLFAAGTAKEGQVEAIGAILGLARGIVLYTLAMVVVTLLIPVVIIGSLLFGLSIRLLLMAAGTAKKGAVDAMGAVLSLAKGILLYTLAMIVVTLLMPVVLIGTLIFVAALWLISKGLDMIGDKKSARGVLVLLGLSLVILFFGLSIALFGELVTWESMLKVGTTIAVLSLMAWIIGKEFMTIFKGALVLVALSIALLIFSVGLLVFSKATKDLTWEHLAMMGAVIAGMALIGTILGIPAVAPFAEIGAAVLITLGAAFLIFSVGFLIFAGAIKILDPGDPEMMGESLKEIGWAMAAIGLVSPLVVLGSAAMIVAGAALLPITLGLVAFKSVGFEKADADTLEYSLGKIASGFLGGEIPGGLVAGLKFAVKAAARAALLAVASVGFLAAGVALIPITASMVIFKKAKFGKQDSDNLEYMLSSVVKAFGIVTDYKRQKELGFYVNPFDLFLGIESLSGAGRVLAGLAAGVQAWANLEVTEWEVVNGGTKDAKLVIKGKRKLSKSDFENAANGMATVISAIAKPFADVGQLEKGGLSGNPIIDAIFGGGLVSTGINALKRSGDTITSLAQGVQAFANLEITEYEVVGAGTMDAKLVPKSKRRMKDAEIQMAGYNIGKIITVVAAAFAEVGRTEKASEGIFADGYVGKGVSALAGVGDTLTAMTEGVIKMAYNEIPQFELIAGGTKDAKLVPAKPIVLTSGDLQNAAYNIGNILGVVAGAFAKIGRDEAESEGWFEDGYVAKGVQALSGIGDIVSKITEAVIKFATGEIPQFTLVNGGTKDAKLVPGKSLKLTRSMMEAAGYTIGSIINIVGKEVAYFGQWAEQNGSAIGTGVEAIGSMTEALAGAAKPFEEWGKIKDTQTISTNMVGFLNTLKDAYDPDKNPNIGKTSYFFGQFATNAELITENADAFTKVADNFDRIQKSMKLIQTHINGMDLKKLTLTDSMMKSIAALSKNPEAVAKAVAKSIDDSFEELIKALKELAGAQGGGGGAAAPAASGGGKATNTAAPTPDKGKTPDKKGGGGGKGSSMPTTMDVYIKNVDDLATKIAQKMPSDRRLKTNIKYIGKSNFGIKMYEFNYLHNLNKRYVGCMAQDLLGTEFEKALIIDSSGYYGVDYSYLDFECIEI